MWHVTLGSLQSSEENWQQPKVQINDIMSGSKWCGKDNNKVGQREREWWGERAMVCIILDRMVRKVLSGEETFD